MKTASAGGGAGMVHLLASLTSIATCLLVVVCLGSAYKPYLGSLLGVHGGPPQRSIQLRGPGQGSGGGWPGDMGAEGGCLAEISHGSWRGVSNLTRPSPPPPEVAAWHVVNALPSANESIVFEWFWAPSAVNECGMRRRLPTEVRSAFSNKRLVFLGDSHVLYMHNHLATALGGKGLESNASGAAPRDLSQTVSDGRIHVKMHHRASAEDISSVLGNWSEEQWPDVLVMGALEWSVMLPRNLSQHLSQMRALLTTLREQAPPSTFLAWLSPQTSKRVEKSELPNDWVWLFANVAKHLGFYRPQGPAFHLNLFQVTLECSRWCLAGDNVPVHPTVNDLLVQQLTNAFLAWAASPLPSAQGAAPQEAPH